MSKMSLDCSASLDIKNPTQCDPHVPPQETPWTVDTHGRYDQMGGIQVLELQWFCRVMLDSSEAPP